MKDIDTKNQIQPNTKERILDSAERLFATRGFRGTSVKRIADDAHVNQAAINYHFGSKMELIRVTIDRRLEPINRERMERLEFVRQDAEQRHTGVQAKEVLRAFIEPTFFGQQTSQERKYLTALLGRALWESDKATKRMLAEHFIKSFVVFFDLMKQALPWLPENVLRWRLHFTGGVITHCMGVCSSGMTSIEALIPNDDLEATVNLLVDFVTTGVCGPYSPDSGDMQEPELGIHAVAH